MRTRPQPRNGEATTATIRTRYIPLRNQSSLISWGLVRSHLVRVLLLSAGFPLPGEHLVLVIHGSQAFGGFMQGFRHLLKALVEFLLVVLPLMRGRAGGGAPQAG